MNQTTWGWAQKRCTLMWQAEQSNLSIHGNDPRVSRAACTIATTLGSDGHGLIGAFARATAMTRRVAPDYLMALTHRLR